MEVRVSFFFLSVGHATILTPASGVNELTGTYRATGRAAILQEAARIEWNGYHHARCPNTLN